MKNASGRKPWPPLLHRVVRTIRSRDLLRQGQHVLIALSGGPDSVALLSLLHQLQSSWSLMLTAVHCNYGLRGCESEGDQQFVETLCRELRVPLHVKAIDLRSRPPRSSLQAVARARRYQVFTEVATHCGADRIAVGHTAEDQAETVVLWMLRGAGLTGVSGMPACRDGSIVRPLYDVRRQDILTYLEQAQRSFREDSSNGKPLYLRNRIRHEVMPALQRLVPSTVESLCRLADLCREDDRYLEQHVAELCGVEEMVQSDGSWMIQQGLFRGVPKAVQRRLLRTLLRRSDLQQRAPHWTVVDRVMQTVSQEQWGAIIPLQAGWIVVDRDAIRCTPSGTVTMDHGMGLGIAPQVLPIPGKLVWSGTGQVIQVQHQVVDDRGMTLGRDYIVVDAQVLSQPWHLRSWVPGDRFYPFGMHGHSKKLQDFFTDQQVPVATRTRIPLLVAPEGIVWVVGYRHDQRWVPTASTERCLVVTVSGSEYRDGRD